MRLDIERVKAMVKATPQTYRAKRTLRRKKALVEQLGGKCQRCGWTPRSDLEYAALDLHHTDPKLKGSGCRAEAASLRLLCANCHRITHAGSLARQRHDRPTPTKPDPLDRIRQHYLRKHNPSAQGHSQPAGTISHSLDVSK